MPVRSVGRTGSLSYCQSILIVVLGTCDPKKCRMRCLLKISPELPIELCNRFWRWHKTMVSRHNYLDKVVKGVGVKRRKPGTDPTKSVSYLYRLYPRKKNPSEYTPQLYFNTAWFIRLTYNWALWVLLIHAIQILQRAQQLIESMDFEGL